jgi:hypothetical protein
VVKVKERWHMNKKKLLGEKFVQDHIIEYLFRHGWGRNLRSKALDEHFDPIIAI